MEDDPRAWAPDTRVGDLEEAFGSWLRPGSALAIVAGWGVNQKIKDLSLTLSNKLADLRGGKKEIGIQESRLYKELMIFEKVLFPLI